MKKSNIFILSGSVLFLLFFLYSGLHGKKVTVEAYKENREHSLDNFEEETYNYARIAFGQPIHEIVIQDSRTNALTGRALGEKQIRLVRSKNSGMKKPQFERYIKGFNVENGVLTITIDPAFSGTLKDPIVFYAPRFEQISIKNNLGLRLVETHLNALTLHVDSGSLAVEPSNRIQELTVEAKNHSTLSVELDQLTLGNYQLENASQIESRTRSCQQLKIRGDKNSQVRLGLPKESVNSQYGAVEYNDQIGQVILETSEIKAIQGDPARLKLEMDIPGFKKITSMLVH